MRLLATLTFCAALAASCGNGGTQVTAPPQPPQPPPLQRPVFDQARAFADLEAQVAFGPRTPASEAHENCKQFLIDRLTAAGARMVTPEFSATTPLDEPEYDFMNILGIFSEDKPGDVLLLGAHWDSRAKATRDPDPEKRDDPDPGANDGASGCGILLELARGFAEVAPPRPIIICFFDAEDQGVSGANLPQQGWAIGSRELANDWPADALPWPDEMILLDLVGGDNVHNPAVGLPAWANDVFDLPMERNSLQSAPDLLDRVWSAAERRGHAAFNRTVGNSISDDHIPFQELGVEAIDIIDFAPPEWDTTHDTPENCDPASLGQVGDTLVEFIYGP